MLGRVDYIFSTQMPITKNSYSKSLIYIPITSNMTTILLIIDQDYYIFFKKKHGFRIYTGLNVIEYKTLLHLYLVI